MTDALPQSDLNVKYSVIYLIHGDADYTFHTDNLPRQADEEVMKDALSFGRKAASGEVFIYHQKAQKGLTKFLNLRHRDFHYFRQGKLLASGKYKPESSSDIFSRETQIYKDYSAVKPDNSRRKVLLYFGHEIPPQDGRGYHQSYPQANLNYRSFVQGMDGFSTTAVFDLIVLSTCNNGTPLMADLLKNRTRYLLASPQNLHLSHIDSEPLSLLENREKPLRQVAEIIAESTYRRLTESIQTAVTLSLYDMSTVKHYIPQLSAEYSSYLHGRRFRVGDDNIDCASLPFFKRTGDTAGVQRWYRSARFGQDKGKSSHSGWGCQQLQ